jgi:hypothetical protein
MPTRRSGRSRRHPQKREAADRFRLSAGQGVNFRVFRKPAELLFGKGQPSVDGDLEDPCDPFDELHLCTAFHEPCLRTEGPRFIVSRHAVFDPDFHHTHLTGSPIESYHGGTLLAIPHSQV